MFPFLVPNEKSRLIALIKRKRDLDLFTVSVGQFTHLAPIFFALPSFFMKGTGPQRAKPPALKICIKKLLPKGNQSSDKRTIKRS